MICVYKLSEIIPYLDKSLWEYHTWFGLDHTIFYDAYSFPFFFEKCKSNRSKSRIYPKYYHSFSIPNMMNNQVF